MTTKSDPLAASRLASIEIRSIDYVPSRERTGRLSDQATIWFAGSAHLLSLATGAIGITLGLNLSWTLIALLCGNILGTIPVAAHATQGPHLGLPQMVQSRPQFGRYGALFIWALAVVVYFGNVVLGGNVLGLAGAELSGNGNPSVWAIALGVVVIVLAIFGHHWLHVAQRIVSIALIIAVALFLIGLAVTEALPASAFDLGGTFDAALFFTVVSASAAFQLSWAFYVSDYSRYMPAHTRRSSILGFTSAGLIFGIMAFEVVGAVCAALLPSEGLIAGLHQVGDALFPGMGAIMIVTGGLGLLGVTAMSVYGGSLTLITALDSIRPIVANRRIRVVTILIMGIVGVVAAALLPDDFIATSFVTVLTVLAYLMAPWTSVNLSDFFLVRRGHYSVREMFKRDGMYGLWNWRGLTAYAVTLAIMIPFMNLGWYTGPVSAAIGGIDVAFFVGLPVGFVLYWVFCRNIDLAAEKAIIAHSDRDLDAIAAPVEPHVVRATAE